MNVKQWYESYHHKDINITPYLWKMHDVLDTATMGALSTVGGILKGLFKGGLSHSKVSTIYIVSSIFISISFFVGGVVTIQTALNINSPLIPKYLVGFATRQSVILEFAPTFISVIMAGKVVSFITSSIGSMRVTEQIDALEVMGVNSINYLVFPKTIAMLLYPFVITKFPKIR